jgi:hypothetical protein
MVLKYRVLLPLIVLPLVVVSACGPKAPVVTSGPHATVTLRDGSVFAGVVTATSPQQITVMGDDPTHTTKTFDMQNVRSVEYGDQVAVAQQPYPSSPAPAPAPAPALQQQQAPPPPRYHPEESAIRTRSNVLPVGTQIAVRTDEPIDSGKAVEGQTYAAEVSRDIVDADGDLVIPRGSNARIVIRSATKGGRFKGTSDLVLDLESVSVGGRLYQLSTTDIEEHGRAGIGKNKRTAEFVGGGAVLGTIIGAIAGGGKGAAIGGASGAAAGTAGQVLTKGGSVRVPAESLLTFRLDRPLRVYPRR